MSKAERLNTNVPDPLYVNTACINCDTCRQLAPDVFSEIDDLSAVTHQPSNELQKQQAFHALLACPTAAIVSEEKEGLEDALADFPMRLEDGVYYCGFNSRKSFGGNSYFIVHPDGNWLIDSPRYLRALTDKFSALGGIRYIFLTHRDDVADAEKYASHFHAERIIHLWEKSAQPEAEHFFEGTEPKEWGTDFCIIPTPGHTKGHMVLLYKQRYLFTGDHLAWNRDVQGLASHRDYCWYSFSEQIKSMEKLARYDFEWILPGHGERVFMEEVAMRRSMEELIVRMKRE